MKSHRRDESWEQINGWQEKKTAGVEERKHTMEEGMKVKEMGLCL